MAVKTGILIVLTLLCLPVPLFAAEFHGYPCTKDCSGHKAGYEWAQRRGITDPDECGGNSNSFIEGCRAWAQENGDDEEASEESETGSAE